MMATHRTSGKVDWENRTIWTVLAWIGIALQAAGVAYVIWADKWGAPWIIGAFLAFSLALMLINKLPSFFSFLVVVAAVANAGGWVFNWYDAVHWFDEAIHFYTGFSAMAAIAYIAAEQIDRSPGSVSFVVKVALGGLVLGVIWEAIEALFLNLSLGDTIGDLALDTAGAALGGWVAGASWPLRGESRRLYA